jgi:hypothetical protein
MEHWTGWSSVLEFVGDKLAIFSRMSCNAVLAAAREGKGSREDMTSVQQLVCSFPVGLHNQKWRQAYWLVQPEGVEKCPRLR